MGSLFGVIVDFVVSSFGSFHWRNKFLTALSIGDLVTRCVIREPG